MSEPDRDEPDRDEGERFDEQLARYGTLVHLAHELMPLLHDALRTRRWRDRVLKGAGTQTAEYAAQVDELRALLDDIHTHHTETYESLENLLDDC